MNKRYNRQSAIKLKLPLAMTAMTLMLSAGYANASIGPISVLLSPSLNSTGNNTPSITFGGGVYDYNTYAYAQVSGYTDSSNFQFLQDSQFGSAKFSSTQATIGNHLSQANAIVTSGVDVSSIAGLSLSTSGYTLGTALEGTPGVFQADSDAPYSVYGDSRQFTITPYTTVTFSALAKVSIVTTTAYEFSPERYRQDGAFALTGFYGGTDYAPFFYDSLSITNNPFIADLAQDERILSLTFVNDSAESQIYYFNAHTVVSGSSIDVMAVPEPETYAMLLAGLGLVGFSARRRQV